MIAVFPWKAYVLIFKPGKTVFDYLRLAGGPIRGSDKGRSSFSAPTTPRLAGSSIPC